MQTERGTVVSILVARSIKVWKNSVRWIVDPHPDEGKYVTLLARLTEENGFLDFYVLPGIREKSRFRLNLNDPWLKSGKKLRRLEQFLETVEKITRY